MSKKEQENKEELTQIAGDPKEMPEQNIMQNPMLKTFPWLDESVELEKYNYGDLFIKCGNCGSDNAMLHPNMRNVQTMFPIESLIVSNKSTLALSCAVCGTKLGLHFKESANPPKSENENKEEDQKAESVMEEAPVDTVADVPQDNNE